MLCLEDESGDRGDVTEASAASWRGGCRWVGVGVEVEEGGDSGSPASGLRMVVSTRKEQISHII